ncbi:hypothetical protein BV25DRAFT_1839383 [Artomyces pyxidatus]|uniref:Uncharacterized protein n=1 Tax=Artomyces pyxidatus TaxID=48021 RepID=A0ACB8SWG3_9AGAM|nr:hypothetical protein BV25DRAFT_1839383 [Artomyces pyxidatus]
MCVLSSYIRGYTSKCELKDLRGNTVTAIASYAIISIVALYTFPRIPSWQMTLSSDFQLPRIEGAAEEKGPSASERKAWEDWKREVVPLVTISSPDSMSDADPASDSAMSSPERQHVIWRPPPESFEQSLALVVSPVRRPRLQPSYIHQPADSRSLPPSSTLKLIAFTTGEEVVDVRRSTSVDDPGIKGSGGHREDVKRNEQNVRRRVKKTASNTQEIKKVLEQTNSPKMNKAGGDGPATRKKSEGDGPAKKTAEETAKRQEAARKMAEEASAKKAEEVKRMAEEARRKVEEAERKEAELRLLEEEARRALEESKKLEGQVRRKEERARALEAEIRRKNENVKQREEALRQREEDLAHREAAARQEQERAQLQDAERKGGDLNVYADDDFSLLTPKTGTSIFSEDMKSVASIDSVLTRILQRR